MSTELALVLAGLAAFIIAATIGCGRPRVARVVVAIGWFAVGLATALAFLGGGAP